MKPLYEPNIVTIGGGTGLSTFLSGLKAFPVNINAIVTVADDGGSSGKLREDLKIPPPGDIRNVLVALSNSPDPLQQLLQFRFEEQLGDNNYLDGHPVGNLILAAMTQICDGDFNLAVKRTAEMLNVKGVVYPVTHEDVELCGKTIAGDVIKGESKFADTLSTLHEVFYERRVEASPGVLQAIKHADVIVLGPGSLYTSVLPNIIIPEVVEAINNNKKADIVYICNIMTEYGETDEYSVHDHVDALYRHGLDHITKVIVNDQKIAPRILKAYAEERSQEVKQHASEDELPYEVVYSRIAQIKNNIVRHNPVKTAAAVYGIAIDHIK